MHLHATWSKSRLYSWEFGEDGIFSLRWNKYIIKWSQTTTLPPQWPHPTICSVLGIAAEVSSMTRNSRCALNVGWRSRYRKVSGCISENYCKRPRKIQCHPVYSRPHLRMADSLLQRWVGVTFYAIAYATQSYRDLTELIDAVRGGFLHHIQTSSPFEFAGKYTQPLNESTTNKDRVKNIARSLWKALEIRFTWVESQVSVQNTDWTRLRSVKTHDFNSTSHSTKYHCSQDAARVKPPRTKPDGVRRRNIKPMKRWDCGSNLMIRSAQKEDHVEITVRLAHKRPHLDEKGQHVSYPFYDVSPPTRSFSEVNVAHNDINGLAYLAKWTEFVVAFESVIYKRINEEQVEPHLANELHPPNAPSQ